MAEEEVQSIKKQIEKEMTRLRNLYTRLSRLQRKRREPESYRLRRLESELKRKFPDIKVDKSLLRLVGTMPYNPPSKDKEILREIIAERYAER
jgi:hypothetical protein